VRGSPERPKRKLSSPANGRARPTRLPAAVAVWIACAVGLVPFNTRAAAPAQAGQAPQGMLRIVADRPSAQPASTQLRVNSSNKSAPARSTPAKRGEPVHRGKADDSDRSDCAVQLASYDQQLPEHQAEPAEGASWIAARLAAVVSAPSGLEPVLSRPATIPSGNRQITPGQVEPPATEPSLPVPPGTRPRRPRSWP